MLIFVSTTTDSVFIRPAQVTGFCNYWGYLYPIDFGKGIRSSTDPLGVKLKINTTINPRHAQFISENKKIYLQLFAQFILENIKIYLHFISFLKTEMAQVIETLPHGWYRLVDRT